MVTEAGIYRLPLKEYVSDPAPKPSLNTGTAMALLTQSPLHAKRQHPRLNQAIDREESSRADLGTVAHALLLEDDASRVVEIDADDWRTKKAKEERDAARECGKVPVLKKDYDTVQRMVERAQVFLLGSDLCEDWLSATAEQTLIWQEPNGVWCRSRPDKLTPDGKVYFDYKTTSSAHPSAFVKVLVNQGYDLQGALGKRGVKALKGVEATVVFVVQEIEEPYACSLVTLSPHFTTVADERLALAMEKWRQCITANDWPGYRNQVATIDPPGWYGLEQWEEL